MKRAVIVIPAYNEAATIGGILHECQAALPGAGIIVVDDGSRDRTGAISRQNGAQVLRNPVNSGKGASLARGLLQALSDGADHAITLDGDGQHRPKDLPRLLAVAVAWPDHVIIGSRRASRHAAPAARYFANRIADFWVSWAARQPIEDSQSGFRVYPAALLREIVAMQSMSRGFAFESEILIEAGRAGYRTVSVDIPAIYDSRLHRPSYFRPLSDITRIVIMVGGKLLRRRMDLEGLRRSWSLPQLRGTDRNPHQP